MKEKKKQSVLINYNVLYCANQEEKKGIFIFEHKFFFLEPPEDLLTKNPLLWTVFCLLRNKKPKNLFFKCSKLCATMGNQVDVVVITNASF